MSVKHLFEACCQSHEEAMEARAGGAGRVELCAELGIGGVTPSESEIRQTLAQCSLPVNVLVRPRGGSFVYSESEARAMLRDIELCKSLGVNGVVIGALTPEGRVDIPLMRRLIEAARPMNITFHRAFDECAEPFSALEDIINLSCDILLTSGQAPSAYDGRKLIAELVQKAGDRIIVMPGAGINPRNISEIALVTKASEFHGSAHGPAGATDRKVVEAIVRALSDIR